MTRKTRPSQFPYDGMEFVAREAGRLYVPPIHTMIPAFTVTKVIDPKSGRTVDALVATVGGPEDGVAPCSLKALRLSLAMIRHVLDETGKGERPVDHVHFKFQRHVDEPRFKFEFLTVELHGKADPRFCP